MVKRLIEHPILPVKEIMEKRKRISFIFEGKQMIGYEGDTIASALHANGVRVLGWSQKLKRARGFFCANGQCNSCLVEVDGRSNVLACMEPLTEGMSIRRQSDVGTVPEIAPLNIEREQGKDKVERSVIEKEFVVIGGGPAGLEAAISASQNGVKVLLIDDREQLGGKLILQTHKFFGDSSHNAGKRGFEIAEALRREIGENSVDVWLNTTVIGIFDDGTIGCITKGKDGGVYRIIRPEHFLIATGAREKMIEFLGSDLPGVYGAGALQTLMNRDYVLPGRKIVMVGAGNVGLIVSYQLVQAGADVVAVVEAFPRESTRGWDVHYRKLKRLGIPFFFEHTVVAVEGKERVERVIIAKVKFERGHLTIIPNTEKVIEADTLCLGVGLNPVNELKVMADSANQIAERKGNALSYFTVGDASEIDEATVAMIEGRILGLKIAVLLGKGGTEKELRTLEALLSQIKQFDVRKHRRVWLSPELKEQRESILKMLSSSNGPKAVIECYEEIPCNPCVSSCPFGNIRIEGNGLIPIPVVDMENCNGCGKCVVNCPGLAIRIIDYNAFEGYSLIQIPFEMLPLPKSNERVQCTDDDGREICDGIITKVHSRKNKTNIVELKVPKEFVLDVYGFRFKDKKQDSIKSTALPELAGDTVICRCEDITRKEIESAIDKGFTTVNEIKRFTRAGMGTCQGKNCRELIVRIISERLGKEQAELSEKEMTPRPPLMPVPADDIMNYALEGKNEI